MVKILSPQHLIEAIPYEMFKDISKLSLNDEEIEIINDNRGRNSGQYIRLIKDDVIKYICVSGKDALESRNSFILQNFPTAYQYYLMETNSNKEFEYYIRDCSVPHPAYTIFAYKVLLTSKIKILNLDKVIPSDNAMFMDHRTPFYNLKQMRNCRLNLQQRNSGNNSTLFEENEEDISVYGKTYGANGRETTAICLAISNLIKDKKIKLYNVNETDISHQASVDPSNEYILKRLNVDIDENALDFDTNNEEVKAKRETSRYHYNLLNKFKEKKCYLCECDIERLIIGSHIHRVTDITHSNMSEEEKQIEIVDGDNGFWLCANHDKLFEYGLIYFEGDKLVISNKLNYEQKSFVQDITTMANRLSYVREENEEYKIGIEPTEFRIKPEHYTEKMHEYLEKHRIRTQDNK